MSRQLVYLMNGPGAGKGWQWDNPPTTMLLPAPFRPPVIRDLSLLDTSPVELIEMEVDEYDVLARDVILYKYRGRRKW